MNEIENKIKQIKQKNRKQFTTKNELKWRECMKNTKHHQF